MRGRVSYANPFSYVVCDVHICRLGIPIATGHLGAWVRFLSLGGVGPAFGAQLYLNDTEICSSCRNSYYIILLTSDVARHVQMHALPSMLPSVQC